GILLVCLALFGLSSKLAKEKDALFQQTVTGSVSSSDGVPLPGVSILVQGTSIGVVTDFDGTFTLDVPSDAILEFSYIGFKTTTIALDGRSTINVTLEEDLAQLEEVVVVGYGTQKRSDVTGSVSSVPEGRLENLPVTNVTQAIQGTTAG